MKRSRINDILREAAAFFEERKFILPPFAQWSLEEWNRRGEEASGIIQQGLGWDITDFGSGDFKHTGLFLFTLRNGDPHRPDDPAVRQYAEKIMMVREDQRTSTHHHRQKMEDIINRGGGELVMRLWNSDERGGVSDSPVTIERDGARTTLRAGDELVLGEGESVCLPPGLWHEFWARRGGGPVLAGEVSNVNDDQRDNFFLEPVGRFPDIDEDEPPLRLLCSDYARFLTQRGA